LGRAIVISGTPGTGKTLVAKELSKLLNAKYVNLSELVISEGLYDEYDRDRDSYVINEDLLRDYLRRLVMGTDGYVVIDSHYGELIDDDLLSKLIVLRLHPKELLRRLLGKGWALSKVAENVEAEIVGVCTYNALNEHPKDKVCEVNTTDKSVHEVVNEVLGIINGEVPCRVWIDWLSDPKLSEVLMEIRRLYNVNDKRY